MTSPQSSYTIQSAKEIPPKYKKEAWAGLSGHLQEHISAGDAVLICEKYLYQPLEFYLGEKMPAVYYANPAKRRVRLKISSSDSWQPYRPSANSEFPEVVWVASRHGRCSAGMEPILWTISGNRYSAGESWQGHALMLTSYRR